MNLETTSENHCIPQLRQEFVSISSGTEEEKRGETPQFRVWTTTWLTNIISLKVLQLFYNLQWLLLLNNYLLAGLRNGMFTVP